VNWLVRIESASLHSFQEVQEEGVPQLPASESSEPTTTPAKGKSKEVKGGFMLYTERRANEREHEQLACKNAQQIAEAKERQVKKDRMMSGRGVVNVLLQVGSF
jgi:hypothetical protein